MAMNHSHGGHRGRLRKRFSVSPQSFEDHELLELILFYAIPQKDTNALAHSLLGRFGSLNGVLNASAEQLATVSGMGEVSSQMFPVILELLRRYMGNTVTRKHFSGYDEEYVGSHYLSTFFGLTDERVIAIALSEEYVIKGEIIIGEGDFHSSPINTSQLSRFIAQMLPCHIVIAHNHPSGIALPSETDYETTDKLREFIHKCGVRMLDHLIFDGKGDFVSLGTSGQLNDKNRYYYKVSATEDGTGQIRMSFQKFPLTAEIVTKD